MKEPVISISNLSKIYKLYKDPLDRLKESLHPFGKKYHQDFFALKNLSLQIFEGEIVGVVGANGAGKSTLLKILAGVLTPSSGSVQINGRVSALLELGMGFNPELSGRENIIFNATILGLAPKTIEAKLEEIISFADIGAYIDQPLKSYSSGMVARLAFAVAVNIDAEILIIDEALSVGDVRFQQKALRKLQELMGRAKAIVFVSHSMDSIRKFCNRTIWIKDGAVFQDGNPTEVAKDYYGFMTTGTIRQAATRSMSRPDIVSDSTLSTWKDIQWADLSNFSSLGDMEVTIKRASLCDRSLKNTQLVFEGGELLSLLLDVQSNVALDHFSVGFTLNNTLGMNVFGVSSSHFHAKLPHLKQGDRYIVKIDFDLPCLLNGNYTLSPGIAELGDSLQKIKKHHVFDAFVLQILSADQKQNHGSLIIPEGASFDSFKIN
jgi:ABC-type polysaccharide/polyol phosphate transport system ATPase subunit